MRHHELAHLLSNIEKLPLPILGSMFPFWNPTGVFPRSVHVGRLHPHVERGILSLFLASSQFNVLRASTRVRRPPGPTWPGSTRAEAAQHIRHASEARCKIHADGKRPEQLAVSCLQPGAFLPQCVDFLFQLRRPREANRHLAEVVARKKRYRSL